MILEQKKKCSMIRCPMQHKQGEEFDCGLFDKCPYYTEMDESGKTYSDGYAAGFMAGVLAVISLQTKNNYIPPDPKPFSLEYGAINMNIKKQRGEQL